ncbi:hypothetical protein Ssi03_71910 [Sphaerisporangium siamense]|nr:hypothetical protein Ssi03_71910 [Sphaerisporangium siamense]
MPVASGQSAHVAEEGAAELAIERRDQLLVRLVVRHLRSGPDAAMTLHRHMVAAHHQSREQITQLP